ncbi:unnamed protein product [marine sediment metagenome]|uniref:Uncharacterized protein n=1 Tax=marine sediment metagenome TaxID=412755 RepID=X1R8S3_9ZZZZ
MRLDYRRIKETGSYNTWDEYYREERKLKEVFDKNLELIRKLKKGKC